MQLMSNSPAFHQRLLPQQSTTVRCRRGLTLVEVAVSTLLVGMVLVGSLKVVGGVLRTRMTAEQIHDGTALAQELMNEILSQEYEEPTELLGFGVELSESWSNRSNWDDVDDYHNWNVSPPRLKDNSILSDYTGWRRSVSVKRVKLTNPNANSALDEGLKRIEITVTGPDGRQTKLVAWRSKWGTLEQPPVAEATVHTRVTNQLQLTGGRTHYSATAFSNHAQDQ